MINQHSLLDWDAQPNRVIFCNFETSYQPERGVSRNLSNI